MTDHPIPDDLIDRLEGAVRHADEIPNILTALASWADGRLIDPDGWRRVKAERVADIDWAEDDHGFDEPIACNWSMNDAVLGSLNGGTGLYTLTPAPEEER